MCVMYRRFINQAECIVEKHKNHEAAGYLHKVIQDAKDKLQGHRKKVENKQNAKKAEVHPQVMRLVAGARDFQEVNNSLDNAPLFSNMSPPLAPRRLPTN